MKIGIIASIWISNPPQEFGFGAQEYLTYHLAEGLKKRGHDVTLFASGDSRTSVNLVSVTPIQVIDITPSDNKIKDIFELMNISRAYKMAGEFDIIHDHLLPYGLLFADLFPTKTIHTLHHQIYHVSDYYIYERYKDQKFITISNAQRNLKINNPSPIDVRAYGNTPLHLNYIGTVYNGIDPEFYKFKPKPDGHYLLYIGRMKRYKGIHTAIKIAQKLGLELKVATPLPNPSQPDFEDVNEYWEKDIKPQLGGNIQHIGPVSGSKKIEVLSDAKMLLFPIEREEPFGMTLIEAMACGTPVVAYNKGAMSEIIKDAQTGYLVNNGVESPVKFATEPKGFEGLTYAVEKIYHLPEADYLNMRKKSRQRVEDMFTIDKMVEGYEAVYNKVIGDRGKVRDER